MACKAFAYWDTLHASAIAFQKISSCSVKKLVKPLVMKTIQQGRPDKSFTYTLNILQDINIWLQLCFYHVPPFNESKFTEECSELAVTPETIHQWSSLIYNISLKTDQNNMGQQEMGLVARKPVFGGLRTTKAQTSLCIRRV